MYISYMIGVLNLFNLQVPLDQTSYSLFKHGGDVTVLQNKYIKSKSPVDFVVPHISYPLGNVEETRVQLLTPGEKRKRRYQHYGVSRLILITYVMAVAPILALIVWVFRRLVLNL